MEENTHTSHKEIIKEREEPNMFLIVRSRISNDKISLV